MDGLPTKRQNDNRYALTNSFHRRDGSHLENRPVAHSGRIRSEAPDDLERQGRFRTLTGSVQLDPNDASADVDISIDAASLTTGDDKRDAHLRSADFLHVEEHPAIQFN